MTDHPLIPVIMYHSVGRPDATWLWNDLTADVDLFEKQLTLLQDSGFAAITLDDYRDRQEQKGFVPGREVVFTFDDGYLDNWVFAYPLLKRAGFKGTIYVNPEFIDPGHEPRPNLEDVWAGRLAETELDGRGFLNRAELKLMHDSGIMTIASHSMSHTWYPTGPEVVDFHRPGLDTPWLAWNRRPERKFAYLTEDQAGFVPYGHPIHVHGRSLGIRRYLPDPAEIAACTDWVAANGGAAAFSKKGWRASLDEAVRPYAEKGRLETDEERDQRYRYEIFRGRNDLEEIIGGPVDHFAWPGGAYNDDSWALAEEAGFSTICVAGRDRVRWNSDDPALVRRIGCGSNFSLRGGRYHTADPNFLLDACLIALGKSGAKWINRARKIVSAAQSGFRPFDGKRETY